MIQASSTFDPARAWRRLWMQRGWGAWLLRPLAVVYGWLLRRQRQRYRSGASASARIQHLPVPVVVVGNVVVGGTGKTPFTQALVLHLRAQGWQPGLLSRGYGRRSSHAPQMVSANSDPDWVGDEPLLLAQRTGIPVAVGRDRAAAGRLLLQHHPGTDLLICDDGMQHWALARDLTIVVFDARGVGNGWLLPAGMLREPWPAPPWTDSAMLVLRHGNGPALPPHPYPSAVLQRRLDTHAHNAGGDRVELQVLSQTTGRRLAALAGIAQPEGFFEMLEQAGLRLEQTRALPDHASATDLEAALEPGWTWLCTEKDAVKLFPRQPDVDLWCVPLQVTLDQATRQAIDTALAQKGLSSRHGYPTA